MVQFQENVRTERSKEGQTLFHWALPATNRSPKKLSEHTSVMSERSF